MLPCCADASRSCDLLSDNIRNRPHEVFLNDLMFLLSQECKVLWFPPCSTTSYTIHATSPLNPIIRKYIRNEFRFAYASFKIIWYILCRTETEDSKFTKFTDVLKIRNKNIFNLLITNDVYSLFWEIINTAVQCIVFYEQGMHDALTFGVTIMTEMFDEYLAKTGQTFKSILDRISKSVPYIPVNEQRLHGINNIHEVFVRDLLFYLCRYLRIRWLLPPNYQTYRIHIASPLTSFVQEFIIKTYLNPAEMFYKLRAVCPSDNYVFQSFNHALKVIAEEISSATIPQVKNTEQVLMLCIRTAIFSIEIQKRRILNTIINNFQTPFHYILSKTLQELSEALRKCNRRNNGRIFYLFHEFSYLDKKTVISSFPRDLSAHYFFP